MQHAELIVIIFYLFFLISNHFNINQYHFPLLAKTLVKAKG